MRRPRLRIDDRETFTVTSVNSDLRTLAVKDEKGSALSLFYPPSAEQRPTAMKFGLLKPGQKIDVDVLRDKAGDVLRAESVTAKGIEPDSIAPRLNPR